MSALVKHGRDMHAWRYPRHSRLYQEGVSGTCARPVLAGRNAIMAHSVTHVTRRPRPLTRQLKFRCLSRSAPHVRAERGAGTAGELTVGLLLEPDGRSAHGTVGSSRRRWGTPVRTGRITASLGPVRDLIEDPQDGFPSLSVDTPCCGTAVSLDQLDFDGGAR